MRLRNTTNIPDALIREVIRFVRPPGISGFDVRVSNCNRRLIAGRAYSSGSSYHDRAAPFVVCRVAEGGYPSLPSAPHKGYLGNPSFADRTEALVFLMAHELRHLWQARVPKGRRAKGSRGQFSERDADTYAYRKLEEWKRREI